MLAIKNAPIIGFGRLSAYWPIIGMGHFTIVSGRQLVEADYRPISAV